ncbi:Mu transposase domain-containing protein [Nonomuraea dietziae]|uniref:Mu transposase domain-containing protein n=1 Tax=Nonomuraea dietziae TaxID=65515 RepID=UPI0033F1B0CD
MKTGVDRPDLYDPKINKSYGELGAYYQLLIDPARSGKPRDKARIERPMPYIRDSFWRGREDSFASVADMEAAALHWCEQVAGQRQCRPLEGAATLTVFHTVEQPALRPLRRHPFELCRWFRAKVGPDIHCSVDKVLYSVPWKYVGKHLSVRMTVNLVQFFYDGDLVKTHVRKPRGKQTDLADYPPEKIAFHMRTPAWCRKQAEQIGPACLTVID